LDNQLSEHVIELKDLSKRFKDVEAVHRLNLNVQRGDVFGFLGPNGAGKSTTIRMMLSLIRPTEGEIFIFGKNLRSHRDEILRRIGAIIEKPDFYNYLSAYKNIEIFGRMSGCDTSKTKIMESLDLVGLSSRYNSKVKTFSFGMKQRLGIAQALLHDPELIILDEPTTGLDPQGVKEVRELITHLSKDRGKTIMLSSHILYEVELVATRMIIISKGKKIIEGAVHDLLDTNKMQVTLNVDDVEKTKEIFAVKGLTDAIQSINEKSITITLDKNAIADINALLVTSGIAVSAVIPKHSLEDYFLRLTESEGK
jgi:ABC-type multidrug transport system ATPase subunit